ncbi:plasmid-related protein [Halomonas sp. H33-56]|uniref:plasmid-related protein n=1 Tax=Halomonas sp. H33-56 TaxID=2950873 RepID=UPI0032DE68A5
MKTKDCGMRIRVDKQLREEFLEACRSEDRAASDVLREFMRTYIKQHSFAQHSLFRITEEG